MSTTTQRRPISSIDPVTGAIRLRDDWRQRVREDAEGPSECGGCGQSFDDLIDLFGHPCSGSATRRVADVHTVPADTPDRTRPQGNGTGRGRPARPVSDAQRALIARLLDELGAEFTETVDFEGLTGGRGGSASALIDRLMAAARTRRQARPEPTAEQRGCRPNRYAGNCRHCGQHVAAEAGFLCQGESGWEVEHNGSCPEPQAQAPAADVPAGYYAIDSTGHNDLAFYRVDRPTEGKWAGRVFVKLVVGGHADRNVRRDHVDGILARIAEVGPQAAAERYGQEIGQCGRCNRALTDEESRRLGIGPVCRAMDW